MLGGAISDLILEALLAGPAGNAHDMTAALGLHHIPDRPATVEQAAQADPELLPVQFGRSILKTDQRHVDGVVHQHIQPAPARHNLIHRILKSRQITGIQMKRHDLAAVRL